METPSSSYWNLFERMYICKYSLMNAVCNCCPEKAIFVSNRVFFMWEGLYELLYKKIGHVI